MSTTSVTLLERVRGRPGADVWQRFVDLYSPILLRYARSRNVPDPDAEDLIQDVFVVLLEKLPAFEYRPGQGFRRWLFTILINKWRDRARAAARRPTVGELPDPPADDPADLLAEDEYNRQLVARAMELMRAEFEPATWNACWEQGVLGRPAAEVAAELGLTPNAVYLATSRVLRRLRAELRGLLD